MGKVEVWNLNTNALLIGTNYFPPGVTTLTLVESNQAVQVFGSLGLSDTNLSFRSEIVLDGGSGAYTTASFTETLEWFWAGFGLACVVFGFAWKLKLAQRIHG